jgi:hypothetical protein
MKTKHIALVAAGLISCLSGCVSNPTALALVNPDAACRSQPGSDGYLKVYTATQTVEVDFGAYFHPHMGYNVSGADGRPVEFVPNHTSNLDESPDEVALPPGRYNIVAESAWRGLVTVPVTIERGKTTIVRLDQA